MQDLKAWLKEIQENETFAKKYKSLNNVKLIIKQARKDGYGISEEDLNEKNLKKISGGVEVRIINQKANIDISATGDHSTAVNSSSITMNGN